MSFLPDVREVEIRLGAFGTSYCGRQGVDHRRFLFPSPKKDFRPGHSIRLESVYSFRKDVPVAPAAESITSR